MNKTVHFSSLFQSIGPFQITGFILYFVLDFHPLLKSIVSFDYLFIVCFL